MGIYVKEQNQPWNHKQIAGNATGDNALDATSDNNIKNKVVAAKLGDTDISDIGDGTVTGAVSQLDSDLGSKSSASAVTGNDAFSKIATLKNTINVIGSYYTNDDSFISNSSGTQKRCGTLTNIPAGKYIVFGFVVCSKNLPTVELLASLRSGSTILSTARGYANSGGGLNLIGFVNVTNTNDLNITVYDGIGNSATIQGFIRAVRLI